MAVQLRYSLGRSIGANILPDPTFLNACGVNWVCEKDWAINPGVQATFTPTGPGDIRRGLRENGILTQGQRYRVVVDRGGVQPPWVFLGDYKMNYTNDGLLLPAVFTVDGTCLSANLDFGIYGVETAGPPGFGINSVYVYPLDWNPPLTDEPQLLLEAELKPSDVIESLTLGFVDKIKFIGDGYQYFIDNFGESKTPLRIEYNENNSGWVELTNGEVYFTDRVIDYDRKTITLKYEDKSIMNVLRKGKDNQVLFRIEQGLYDQRILDSAGGLITYSLVNLHNPATGAYTDTAYIFRLFYAFMVIVHEISDLDIHIDASPLENMLDLGGAATDFLGIIDGDNLANPAVFNYFHISFQQIVENFYKMTNIAIVPQVIAGVKTLVMELRSTFIVNSGITFNNIPKIVEEKSTFDFRSFTTGFKKPDLNRTQSNIQYISETEFFDDDKDLVCDWIQNGDIIWAVANSGNTDYEDDIHMVEYFDNAGAWQSQIFGANFYNGDLDADDNIGRFANVMTGSYIFSDGSAAGTTLVGTSVYVRIFNYLYPISIAQYLIFLNNPYAFVTQNSTYIDMSTGLAVNAQGYPIDLKYDIIKGMATFKMLTQ